MALDSQTSPVWRIPMEPTKMNDPMQGTNSSNATGTNDGSTMSSPGGRTDLQTSTPFGATNASDTVERCDSCGQTLNQSEGVEALLAKIGLNEQMLTKVREALGDLDLEEQLRSVKTYLSDSTGKAKDYAKANPGKVAGGIAALAIGAGLLVNSLRDKR